MRRMPWGVSATTVTRFRTKSNGISASLLTRSRFGVRALRMASSSGLVMPVSSAALQAARSSTSADDMPEASYAPSTSTMPSVSVPVLSVQRMSTLPRFSIALNRRTSTPCRAIIWAPLARLTLRIAGSSSGLSPTASATEKSSVSTGGRPRNTCATKTRSTMISMALVNRYPKRRMPRSNSVSGGRSVSRCAMAPNSVDEPVLTTRQRAVPLRTFVPRETQLVRLARPGGRRDDAGPLLNRKAFAGQDRLADEAVRRVENDAVGRDEAAGREQHDVARHDELDRHERSAGHHGARWPARALARREPPRPSARCIHGNIRCRPSPRRW